MYSEYPPAPVDWQAGIAVLALLPAIFIGYHAGLFVEGMGRADELGSMLLRGLVCAAGPVVLALLAPRFWLLPTFFYGVGFYYGYTFLDAMGQACAAAVLVLLSPLVWLMGQSPGTAMPPEPKHPELLWLFVIAIWCAAFTAFLRRHFSRTNESVVNGEGA